MRKKLYAVFAVLIAGVAAWHFGLKDIFSLDYIQTSGAAIKATMDQNLLLGTILFIVVYVVSISLIPPLTVVLCLLAGFLFGMGMGTGVIVIGDMSAATLMFLFIRSSFGKPLRQRAGKIYLAAESEMRSGAISYMLFMRLVPVFPFTLANIIPGLFHVPLRTFLWTTLIGILPSTVICTYLGQTISSLHNFEDLFSLELTLGLALLGLLALIPLILKKIKARKA